MLHYNPQHISSSTLLIFRRTQIVLLQHLLSSLCYKSVSHEQSPASQQLQQYVQSQSFPSLQPISLPTQHLPKQFHKLYLIPVIKDPAPLNTPPPQWHNPQTDPSSVSHPEPHTAAISNSLPHHKDTTHIHTYSHPPTPHCCYLQFTSPP